MFRFKSFMSNIIYAWHPVSLINYEDNTIYFCDKNTDKSILHNKTYQELKLVIFVTRMVIIYLNYRKILYSIK